jgi:hypothetical protein
MPRRTLSGGKSRKAPFWAQGPSRALGVRGGLAAPKKREHADFDAPIYASKRKAQAAADRKTSGSQLQASKDDQPARTRAEGGRKRRKKAGSKS